MDEITETAGYNTLKFGSVPDKSSLKFLMREKTFNIIFIVV